MKKITPRALNDCTSSRTYAVGREAAKSRPNGLRYQCAARTPCDTQSYTALLAVRLLLREVR